MISEWYDRWMIAWETALTSRDTNRIVRPLEWGFEWLQDAQANGREAGAEPHTALDQIIGLNERLVRSSANFFDYKTPRDYRIEYRYPGLFPTNVRSETLAQDARIARQAAAGEAAPAPFLRFTSAARSPYPENDVVNARWYPAESASASDKRSDKPKQAIIVMPQWNADAFSHNALCHLFNSFGISALRLSKPYHDIRRPAELERSDYAVSANIGRTIASCRQAVVDIRSSLDWLEAQGYTHFGVLGTSLGSCYAFIAAAHDPRLRICAFNHAATWFGDVVWTGQSTRHIRAAFEAAGLSQDEVRRSFRAVSPMAYMEKFASSPKRVLVVHAKYDLTFLPKFSHDVLESLERFKVDYTSRVLPCGHYTTGETPYKFLDGWYLGSFIHSAFRDLAKSG